MLYDDDSEIVIELVSGSKKAFEQIFYKYHKRVYSFSLRLLGDTYSAEEITQRVFVAIWDQRKRIDETKLLTPYIFSIARYLIYQEFRLRVYRKAVFEEISSSQSSFVEITKDEILYNELFEIMQKVIDDLPPRQKEIFRLNRDSRLTYKQIAVQLGISENTVDTHIRRALAHIRKMFESYYKDV
jgi:RNA polymerase sigma-70 factor, ECF subfamily